MLHDFQKTSLLENIYRLSTVTNKCMIFFPKSVSYKRNKNLTKLLSPSLFPRTTKQNECSLEECSRKRDICKNFLVVSTDVTLLLSYGDIFKNMKKHEATGWVCPLGLKSALVFTKVI